MVTETTVYNNPSYNMASAGTLEIFVTGKHNYSSVGSYGNAGAWQLTIYVDGVNQNYVNGAGGVTDSPNCSISIPGLSAGNHSIRIGWYGATNITLLNVNVLIQVLKK